MKSLTVKQAQKWFDKLKTNNPNSFKDILKYLKKFEKTNDQYDCFIKINTVLLQQPQLTRQLNNYLEEANRFVVNKTEVERINELVKYVKKVKPGAFDQIVLMIKDLSNRRGQSNCTISQEQQNRLLKNFVLQKLKGDIELQTYAEKALNYSAEEMVKKLDLSHLTKSNKSSTHAMKNQESLEVSHYQPQPARHQEHIVEQAKPRVRLFPPFLNTNEQKVFMRNIENIMTPEVYEDFIKAIEIYQLGIITRAQILQFVKCLVGAEYDGIKDILQSRETDRRRNCKFKPLNDMNFNDAERATHSYVNMPPSYPHICSSSNKLSEQTLNRKWVSVPQGSQDQFNLRVRNTYEQNLIRAEDDRYQVDLNIMRLRKAIKLIDMITEKLNEDPSADVEKPLKTLIRLQIIQYIYKQATKQQKDEMEYYLKKNKVAMIEAFRKTLKNQLVELQQTRAIHGLKVWNQNALKNSVKALDFKGHQFKRTEKSKIKAAVFIDQLKSKINYLEKKGISRDFDTPFQEKRQFFSVFNSFETTSRKQRCLHRKIATPCAYDIANQKIPTLLPAMILAFEDQKALKLAFSYIGHFIDNVGTNQAEKAKNSFMLRSIMLQFFGISQIQHRRIDPNTYDEEKFYAKIFNQGEEVDVKANQEKKWILIEDSEEFRIQKEQFENQKMKFVSDCSSAYSFKPPKTEDNFVFFASENFYVFLRFLYILYERIIRLYEVSDGNQTKIILFEILYYHSMRSKDSAKLEEQLFNIFKENAYIFTTFYKLVESIVKNISTLSNCQITNYSMKLSMNITNEDIYLLLLNKYYLLSNVANPKILRFTYEKNSTKLLYINSLQSYYKSQQQTKQLQKRRHDINHKIETYTVMRDYLQPNNRATLVSNRMQYHFQGNTIKLVNLTKGEDIVIQKKYKFEDKKSRMVLKKLEKEMAKVKSVIDYLN